MYFWHPPHKQLLHLYVQFVADPGMGLGCVPDSNQEAQSKHKIHLNNHIHLWFKWKSKSSDKKKFNLSHQIPKMLVTVPF